MGLNSSFSGSEYGPDEVGLEMVSYALDNNHGTVDLEGKVITFTPSAKMGRHVVKHETSLKLVEVDGKWLVSDFSDKIIREEQNK